MRGPIGLETARLAQVGKLHHYRMAGGCHPKLVHTTSYGPRCFLYKGSSELRAENSLYRMASIKWQNPFHR